jgi:hypothetical protein
MATFLKGKIMARIFKRTDKIRIKIDDIVVTLSPLSMDQKTRAQELMSEGQKSQNLDMVTKGIIQLVKQGLKDIEGVEDADGNKYQLEIKDNEITDECIDDLFNMEVYPKLMLVCTSLASAVPSEFLDQKGQPIKGVEILSNKKEATDPN